MYPGSQIMVSGSTDMGHIRCSGPSCPSRNQPPVRELQNSFTVTSPREKLQLCYVPSCASRLHLFAHLISGASLQFQEYGTWWTLSYHPLYDEDEVLRIGSEVFHTFWRKVPAEGVIKRLFLFVVVIFRGVSRWTRNSRCVEICKRAISNLLQGNRRTRSIQGRI